LGTLEAVLQNHKIGFNYIETHNSHPIPTEIGDASGLIVMGGPMGVYEHTEYPFLRDEMRLIESALKAGVPVLGVCLGSQLLAAVLGADVTKGKRKELGWYEISLSEDASKDTLFAGVTSNFSPFHWHGDVFSLPARAVRLASSQQTFNQAFRYGRNAYGILFHLEVTAAQIGQMLVDFADELQQAGVDPREIERQTSAHLPRLQSIASGVFGRWASMV
jgi:GMP synthase (glutamine-hydrolysing)